MGNRLVVDLRVEGDARVWLAGLRLELGHDAIRRYASQAIFEQARASELESSSRVGSEAGTRTQLWSRGLSSVGGPSRI